MNALFIGGDAFVEEMMADLRKSFLDGAAKHGIDVKDIGDGLIISYDDFERATAKVKHEAKPCMIVCCSWTNEEQVMHLVRGVGSVPLIVVGFDGPADLISISGVMATSSNLARMRINFVPVVGSMSDERFWRRLDASVKAANCVMDLQGARIGLIGHSCPGMVSMLCDESELQRLGPQVMHIGLAEVMHLAKKQMDDPNITKKIEEDINGIPTLTCKGYPGLPLAVSVYYAIRGLVDDMNLKAVAPRCWPDMPEVLGTSPCYALSRLEDEGIITTCEADILSATTQLALRSLSGTATFVGDTAGFDLQKNLLHLWHTGAAATCLAGTPPVVQKTCLDIPGVTVTSTLKEGKLTLAKLTRPLNGEFSFFIGRGEGVSGPKGEGNNAYIRTEAPIERVIDTLIKNAVEHHIALTYAEVDLELKFLTEFLGIKAVTVDDER
ncbi:MAG: hypothetical protein GX969_06095 [Firmicutes bacterium]|nr:hypothetical protein [Bacillota bacterium]